MAFVLAPLPLDASVVGPVKQLADKHKDELGFHTRASFAESVQRDELLVARGDRGVVGWLRFHHTRRRETSLREVVTCPDVRGRGVGRMLVRGLLAECRRAGTTRVRLSCPAELPANDFYPRLGFRRVSAASRPGKTRPLYEWELPVTSAAPLLFVASLSNAANDLRRLIPLWESEGGSLRPFDACIVTPLFADARSMGYVRHMRERWGVRVWFDSGGFYVQQNKVRYEELFLRLLSYYRANDWADAYVLPDYVPTSRNTPDEVTERVRVTAAEGAKFARRMPAELLPRALGVLQGHTAGQLKLCMDAYLGAGVRRLGFGSFDTGGVNAEINLLTRDAAERLRAVQRAARAAGGVDGLHLFGVGSPLMLTQFAPLGATSFDSSGWMRTAGYGNAYLPFRTRRNVTHGASSLSCGAGLTAAEFYAGCEASGHACAFCRDFGRLQSDRYVRMWHNAIVFSEMTARAAAGREP